MTINKAPQFRGSSAIPHEDRVIIADLYSETVRDEYLGQVLLIDGKPVLFSEKGESIPAEKCGMFVDRYGHGILNRIFVSVPCVISAESTKVIGGWLARDRAPEDFPVSGKAVIAFISQLSRLAGGVETLNRAVEEISEAGEQCVEDISLYDRAVLVLDVISQKAQMLEQVFDGPGLGM